MALRRPTATQPEETDTLSKREQRKLEQILRQFPADDVFLPHSAQAQEEEEKQLEGDSNHPGTRGHRRAKGHSSQAGGAGEPGRNEIAKPIQPLSQLLNSQRSRKIAHRRTATGEGATGPQEGGLSQLQLLSPGAVFHHF
jgi:hypothetical protein